MESIEYITELMETCVMRIRLSVRAKDLESAKAWNKRLSELTKLLNKRLMQ